MMSIFEMGMLLCFGAAWPLNIYKSLKSRTAAGRSILFQWAIIIGYICGIIGKLTAPVLNGFVLFFYVLNLVMVGTDLVLYVRNYRLDKQAEKEAV